MLWILRTGAPWKDLPPRYPPYQTCHRRFQQWVQSGVFRRIAQELAEDLSERGGIDIREAFIDGTFVPAKKGILLSARQSAAKAPRSWPSQDASGIPVSAHIESASPHELKLVEATIDSSFTQYAPDRIVGDKAYDSDGLDERLLNDRGIEMIAPHRKNGANNAPKTVGNFVAIRADGWSNACLHGFRISDAWLFATNTMLTTFSVWCNSVVQLYYFDFFEMASNNFWMLIEFGYLRRGKNRE